jgi:hypothetical protein
MRHALLAALFLLVVPAAAPAFPIQVTFNITESNALSPVPRPIEDLQQGTGTFIFDTDLLGQNVVPTIDAFSLDFAGTHLGLSDLRSAFLQWTPTNRTLHWPYVGLTPWEYAFSGWTLYGDGWSVGGYDFPTYQAGTIGGYIVDVRGWETAYASLPEPTSVGLFLVGLGMVALRRRTLVRQEH